MISFFLYILSLNLSVVQPIRHSPHVANGHLNVANDLSFQISKKKLDALGKQHKTIFYLIYTLKTPK